LWVEAGVFGGKWYNLGAAHFKMMDEKDSLFLSTFFLLVLCLELLRRHVGGLFFPLLAQVSSLLQVLINFEGFSLVKTWPRISSTTLARTVSK
jgi:hypothetical protein